MLSVNKQTVLLSSKHRVIAKKGQWLVASFVAYDITGLIWNCCRLVSDLFKTKMVSSTRYYNFSSSKFLTLMYILCKEHKNGVSKQNAIPTGTDILSSERSVFKWIGNTILISLGNSVRDWLKNKIATYSISQTIKHNPWLGHTPFPAVCTRKNVFATCSHWSIVLLFAFRVIGRCNCFGFGFTTLNCKLLDRRILTKRLQQKKKKMLLSFSVSTQNNHAGKLVLPSLPHK